MNKPKINSRILSVIGFSLSFSYILSFLFEGQVLYSIIQHHAAQSGSYVMAAIIATFAGLASGGFFIKSPQKARQIILAAMLISLLATIPFFFPPSVLWLSGIVIASYASGCSVAGWGYFLKILSPRQQRIKTCADILIYSNIVMIITNVIAIHTSPFAGLVFALLCLTSGMAFIRLLPVDTDTENPTLYEEKISAVSIKKPLLMLYLFVFVITINSGLMYQVINPAFEHLTGLTSWYWAVPYIIALAVMRNFADKMNRCIILYTGMVMLAASFIGFMLLGRDAPDYLIINTLMLGCFGIFDLFWWSILGEMLDYTENPAAIFGLGLSANILGIILGGSAGVLITSSGLPNAEIAVIALSVVCVTLVMLPLLNRMLFALIKQHAYLYDEELVIEYGHPVAVIDTPAPTEPPAPLDPLTIREQDVLHSLLAGKSNKAIAYDLLISESTVKTHLRNIYSKYNVSGRTELITLLLKNKI